MRTKPNLLRTVGALFLLMLAAPFALDLVSAVGAEPCPSAGRDCYPRGAEGPAAGRWSYASKTNYLLRGFSQMALLVGTGLYLILRAGTDRALSLTEKRSAFAAAAAWAGLLLL